MRAAVILRAAIAVFSVVSGQTYCCLDVAIRCWWLHLFNVVNVLRFVRTFVFVGHFSFVHNVKCFVELLLSEVMSNVDCVSQCGVSEFCLQVVAEMNHLSGYKVRRARGRIKERSANGRRFGTMLMVLFSLLMLYEVVSGMVDARSGSRAVTSSGLCANSESVGWRREMGHRPGRANFLSDVLSRQLELTESVAMNNNNS